MFNRTVITSVCRLKRADTTGSSSSLAAEPLTITVPNSSTDELENQHFFSIIEPRTDNPSPDYTFIAKQLRAISQDTFDDGWALDSDQEPYAFTAEELRQLIALKQRTRFLDARVLVGDFESLIHQLHEERLACQGPFPRRIQVAFKRDGLDESDQEYDHWTAIDILLRHDSMGVFYLDSAGDPRNLDSIVNATINHTDTELTLCEDIEINNRSFAIQKDGESCSIFTLDSIFHMSKLHDLHDHVMHYRVPDHSFKGKPVYCLDPGDLPPMLIRNAQSDSFMKRWMDRHPDKLDVVVDKKGLNIGEYLKRHSIFHPTIKKEINAGIQHKQMAYSLRLKLS